MIEDRSSLKQDISHSVKSQDWQYVVENIDIFIAKYPKQFQYYDWKGNALLNLEKYNEAKSLFKEIMFSFPEHPRGMFGLAQVSIRTKQWELALEQLDDLISLHPDFFLGKCWKGNVLLTCGYLERAFLFFEQLTREYPDRFNGFHGLGRVAMACQQWEVALEHFDYVIREFPQALPGYVGKAKALIALEDLTAANTILIEVCGKYPKKLLPLQVLLTVSIQTQEWDCLIRYTKILIQKSNDLSSESIYESPIYKFTDRLISNLIDARKFSDVERLFKAIENNKNLELPSQIFRSRLAYQKNRVQIAKKICFNSIHDNPTCSGYYYAQLAQYAWMNFDLEQALSFCEKVEPSISSEYLEASIIKYKILIRKGKTDLAKNELSSLIRWQPDKAIGYICLIEIFLFVDKNYGHALKTCHQAISNSLKDERIYCYRALALAEVGEIEASLDITAKYLNNYPYNHLVRMARSQVYRMAGRGRESVSIVNRWLELGDFFPISSSDCKDSLNIQYLKCEPGYTVNSQKTVSVIMTTYGWSDLLPVAIGSVLKQTYSNLELIIVDDCSQDDTWVRLNKLFNTDPRIHLLKLQQNSGTYVAKNSGLSIASGDYIAFMDSDDWLHPQTFERQIDALQNPDCLAVMCGFFRVDKDSNIEFKPEGPTGQAHITLCFKRDPVFARLGYFDAVRTGADTEHLERLQMLFGRKSLKRIRFPLLISTRHQKSITGSEGGLGFPWYGPGPTDSIYAASFRKWHRSIQNDLNKAYIPHPLDYRRFEVPDKLLP